MHTDLGDRTQKSEISNLCKQRKHGTRTQTELARRYRQGTCRSCAHDGHAQAWCTHVRNIYAHTKGFVDVGFVDVQCNRQVYGYGQIWCRRIALWCYICHGSMLNALPFCRPKNVSILARCDLLAALGCSTSHCQCARPQKLTHE